MCAFSTLFQAPAAGLHVPYSTSFAPFFRTPPRQASRPLMLHLQQLYRLWPQFFNTRHPTAFGKLSVSTRSAASCLELHLQSHSQGRGEIAIFNLGISMLLLLCSSASLLLWCSLLKLRKRHRFMSKLSVSLHLLKGTGVISLPFCVTPQNNSTGAGWTELPWL